MAKKNTDPGLIAAIVFAAVAVSGSLIYLGTQLGGGVSDEEFADRVEQGIEDYIVKLEGGGEEEVAPEDIDMEELAEDEPFIGDEDAPITLIEYSDYRCGYCKKFHDETWPTLKEQYIDTGIVKFVYKDFLLGYAGDYEAALVAECVRDQEGNEGFFAMHDYIFNNIGATGFNYDLFAGWAVDELGVDAGDLQECFDSEKFGDEILSDGDEGRSLGIRGTPGFFLNGKNIPGAQPFSVFQQAIEAEL